ncbi:hypothetical protein V1505DRAFT_378615 [Lipomyces doorenjongii]
MMALSIPDHHQPALPMAHRAELERYICKHPNFGISTTSRVERSHISSQGPQPEVLSVLKDSQSVLPRNSRPRGTRRLQTSAEIIQIQKAADRIEKVKRGGSCHKVGSDTNSAQSPKLSNQRSPQGTDEGGCVLTQTTNTIAEMAENDAIDDTRGDVEAFHNHDEDDAIFEAMWADALSLL